MVSIQSASAPSFFAQSADMRVHRAGLDFGLVIPDVNQEMLAGLHPPPPLHQQSEQFEFGRRELDWAALDGYFVSLNVNEDLANLQAFDV